MANTLTQSQVEAALKPFGFTGSATGGAAAAFLKNNPAAATAFNSYSASGGKTPVPTAPTTATSKSTTQSSGNTLSQSQVEMFLKPYGFTGSATGGAAQEFLKNNPTAATAFQQYSASGGQYNPQTQDLPVDQFTSNQVQNPQLPAAGTINYTPQQVNANELMTGTGTQVAGATVQNPGAITAPSLGQAAQGTAAQVDANEVLQFLNPNTGQYEAITILPDTPQGTAAQGTVSEDATVAGQLKKLYSESEPGMIPTWAKGAITNANEVMAARGLANSSIGAQAIAAAIQQSALPIAAQDASTFFQMDIKNLDNKQQMELQNVQLRQQSLLSDQAAENAALSFNAQSESQVQQFMASLVGQIKDQNDTRTTTISQFNATQENTFKQAEAALVDGANKFNTQMKSQIEAFNANMEVQRQQFNATNAFAIEQSNVLWRRAINTGNTAGYNAANQTNAQNAFNLSSSSLNNLWQQYADQNAWLNTASENAKDRLFQLTYLANQQQFAEGLEGFDWTSAVGAFTAGLLK